MPEKFVVTRGDASRHCREAGGEEAGRLDQPRQGMERSRRWFLLFVAKAQEGVDL